MQARQLEKATEIFKALADPSRLALLILLTDGERAVSDLALESGDKLGTVSARLKVLHAARLVKRRREGHTIFYSLCDRHVLNLVENAIDHACETHHTHDDEGSTMTDHKHNHLSEAEHPHDHGPDCGHTAVRHGDHIDYLHDGHLHHPDGNGVDEHVIEVSETNPDQCTPENGHKGHEAGHVHGPGCGHEAVPHGDHIDYLVDGRLHHQHGDHCDDHGPLETV